MSLEDPFFDDSFDVKAREYATSNEDSLHEGFPNAYQRLASDDEDSNEDAFGPFVAAPPRDPLPDDMYESLPNTKGLLDPTQLPPRPLEAPMTDEEIEAVKEAMAGFQLSYRPRWAATLDSLDEKTLMKRVTGKTLS